MTTERLTVSLVIAGVVAIAAAAGIGPVSLSAEAIGAALLGRGDTLAETIVWEVRLPRAIAAFLVGLALGASGAALQGLLRNPLAEPGVLGVSATSVLASVTVLYFGLGSAAGWAKPLASIGGAVAATALLALIAVRVSSVVTLILIGVGLSSFSAALMSLLMNFAPNPFFLSDMVNWTLGSVANRSLEDIRFAAPFIVLGLVILFLGRRGLALLSLGEETAEASGLDLRLQRILIVLGAGLATGGAIALAGAIGFVGIVAPHLVRPFCHHDPARILIPSALLGAVMLVIADLLVRLIPTQSELKLGVVAALIGAPVFVWIASQGRLGDD